MATPEPYAVLRGHTAAVNAVHFFRSAEESPQRAVSGDVAGNVLVWSVPTRRVVTEFAALACLDGGSGAMKSGILSVLPHGNSALFSQTRGAVSLWSLDGGDATASRHLPSSQLSFCKCSALVRDDGGTDLLVAPSPGEELSKLSVWDLRAEQCMAAILPESPAQGSPIPTGMLTSLHMFEKAGNVIVTSGYESGAVVVWNVTAGKEVARIQPFTEPVLSCYVSLKHSRGVFAGAGCSVIVTEVDVLQAQFQTVKQFDLTQSGVAEIAGRGDNKVFGTAGWDKRIRIFDMKGMKPLSICKYHTESVYSLAFGVDAGGSGSSCMGHMISGSKDTRVALWSVYPPKRRG